MLLGDAIVLAQRERVAERAANEVLTVATLTGAIQVALGSRYIGASVSRSATRDCNELKARVCVFVCVCVLASRRTTNSGSAHRRPRFARGSRSGACRSIGATRPSCKATLRRNCIATAPARVAGGCLRALLGVRNVRQRSWRGRRRGRRRRSSCTAAWFLRTFCLRNVPFSHWDIAGWQSANPTGAANRAPTLARSLVSFRCDVERQVARMVAGQRHERRADALADPLRVGGDGRRAQRIVASTKSKRTSISRMIFLSLLALALAQQQCS